MKLRFKSLRYLLVALLIFVAIGAVLVNLGQSQDTRSQAAAEKQTALATSNAQALTETLLKQPAPQTVAAKTATRNILLTRKQNVLEVIEKNPLSAFGIAQDSTKLRAQLPDDLQPLVEKATEITGSLETTIVDDFEHKQATYEYRVKQSNGTTTQVFFATEGPKNLLTGTQVRVKGFQLEDRMVAFSPDEKDIQILRKQEAVLGTVTTKKLAVILFNFQNNPNSKPFTTQQAREQVFTKNDNTGVNAYFKENSFEKVSFEGHTQATGDVFGWYTIPMTPVNCETYLSWNSLAEAAAAADGFVRGNYTNVMYVGAYDAGCAWAGRGNLGGPNTWIIAQYFTTKTIGHELGHNFGAHHANLYKCWDEKNYPVAISTNCQTWEYNDPFDIMGYFDTKHLSSFHKGQVGFLDAPNTKIVTTSGTHTLVPMETQSNQVQSVLIPRLVSTNGYVSQYYHLEYRRPHGIFESFLTNAPVVNGVSIRITPPYQNFTQTHLIDTVPGSPDTDGALGLNKTFHDVTEGVKITTTALSAGSATVQVEIGPKEYKRSNPLVVISPPNYTANAGSKAYYSLKVSNRDTLNFGSSPFRVEFSLPTGFVFSSSYISQPTTLTLYPGADSWNYFELISPSQIAPGIYPFSVTVTNTTDPSYKTTSQATVTVSPPIVYPSATPTPSPVVIQAPEKSETRRPELKWNTVVGATSYVVEVSINAGVSWNVLPGTIVKKLPSNPEQLVWIANTDVATSRTSTTPGSYMEPARLRMYPVLTGVPKKYTDVIQMYIPFTPPAQSAPSVAASGQVNIAPYLLKWTKVPPTGFQPIAKSYQIQIATDAKFEALVSDVKGYVPQSVYQTATTVSYAVPANTLSSATTYYWRMRPQARDTYYQYDVYGNWLTGPAFKSKLAVAVLIAPQGTVTTLKPTFKWKEVPQATTYTVQTAPVIAGKVPVWTTRAGTQTKAGGEVSLVPTANLPANTEMLWKVIASNATYGTSDSSTTYQLRFKTP